MTEESAVAAAPALLIRCGDTSRIIDASSGPAIIGRGEEALVLIDHPSISRTHVRVQPRADGDWEIVDCGSRNGFFIKGVRQTSAVIGDRTTISLGDPAGVEVSFEYVDDADEDTARHLRPSETGPERHAIDLGIARAGAAVRARRRELNIKQRNLADQGLISSGALRAFEQGKSWPRAKTQAILEKILQWPPGTIQDLRYGKPVTKIGGDDVTTRLSDEITTTITNVDGAPLMVQAIAIAVQTANTAIAGLPSTDDPTFAERATSILANLRQIEALAANSTMDVRGTSTFAITLSTIRRLKNDLISRAAKSPKATLGQRLYAARQHAQLTVAEAATAAQLPVETIETIEADQAVEGDIGASIESLIATLKGI